MTITEPVPDESSPVADPAKLRIAHARLVGWLEGHFQGIQFATAVRHGIPPSPH
jgi:hypothetical protein